MKLLITLSSLFFVITAHPVDLPDFGDNDHQMITQFILDHVSEIVLSLNSSDIPENVTKLPHSQMTGCIADDQRKLVTVCVARASCSLKTGKSMTDCETKENIAGAEKDAVAEATLHDVSHMIFPMAIECLLDRIAPMNMTTMPNVTNLKTDIIEKSLLSAAQKLNASMALELCMASNLTMPHKHDMHDGHEGHDMGSHEMHPHGEQEHHSHEHDGMHDHDEHGHHVHGPDHAMHDHMHHDHGHRVKFANALKAVICSAKSLIQNGCHEIPAPKIAAKLEMANEDYDGSDEKKGEVEMERQTLNPSNIVTCNVAHMMKAVTQEEKTTHLQTEESAPTAVHETMTASDMNRMNTSPSGSSYNPMTTEHSV